MGRVAVYIEGSRQGIEKLHKLYQAKKLDEIIGYPVVDAELEIDNSPSFDWTGRLVRLGQWLQNVFEPEWQPTKLVLASAYRTLIDAHQLEDSRVESGISRAKVINLGLKISDRQFGLTVKLKALDEEKTNVLVQVHPVGDRIHIPPDLTLAVLDDLGTKLLEVKPEQPQTNYIQITFDGRHGEYFSIEVSLGEASLVEDFVI